MEKISISDVVKYMSLSFFYFILGCSFGMFSGYLLFFFNKTLYQQIINLFVRRLTFGIQYVGNYKIWFILNNLVVILLLISSILIMTNVIFRKRRTIKFFTRFENIEKHRPRMMLFSLYMIPIGVLIINGFLISLLLIYTLLNFGFQRFQIFFLLLLPNGINEILALVLSSSLVLVYLKILKPYILNKRWKEAKKVARQLLTSNTTMFMLALIVLLIIFSGFVEGSLMALIGK